MDLAGLEIGFALTGSFCTLSKVIPTIEQLVKKGANVQPILSQHLQQYDTRFGTAEKWQEKVEEITGNQSLVTIPDVEPIGPQGMLDLLIVAPCTGNTAAKLANAITDTVVTMAVKAHLRNKKPVVLAIATNDALGNNGRNISHLINTSDIYLVPFGQDNPTSKENSLVARMDLIVDTAEYALSGKQLQPVIIEHKGI
ncbi:MAG: dipicolinate synthase subunit B [Bacillota bacterium]